VLGAREVVARAGVALTDRHPRAARGVGPRGARRALREEALAGVAMPVERLVPAFAGDAAVVRTRDAIVTRARHARACAAEASIAGRAHGRVRAHAGAERADVGLRAGVGVVARRAIGLGGIAAGPGRGIAGAGGVALVGGRAHDRVHAHAARALTGIGPRAGVAVVAGGAVGLGGIAAGARRGVAGAGGMARAGGRA